MKHNPFRGTGIALITPFKQDFSVDTESLIRIVNHVVDNGADFLVALGTPTGFQCCSAWAATTRKPSLRLSKRKISLAFKAS